MCWICKLYNIRDFPTLDQSQEIFQALVEVVADVHGTDKDAALLALRFASMAPQSQARH
jgi:hypothetical protein